MNPFFFGDSKQQLFGVYHPARGRSTRGAVLCYPWGREYLLSHASLRLLAQRLAEGGIHTLRFDYLGTGDSAGDACDASQEQWIGDIRTAIAELKEIADVKDIALVGVRLGATLAALAAASLPEVGSLVLWDPVGDGAKYLAELGVPRRNGGPPGDMDVQGAVLTDRLRRDLEILTPGSIGTALPRTLSLWTPPASDDAEPLIRHLRAVGPDRIVESLSDVQAWREEWRRGGPGLPIKVVERIVAWLR